MTVGLFEAKQTLSQFVNGASKSGEILVTRRGNEQTRLVSIPAGCGRTLKEILESRRSFPGIRLHRDVAIEDLIDEGRRV
jgi:antitoxin (DNA-binding transcriptional repressor) of toxin-antitoxin stability system